MIFDLFRNGFTIELVVKLGARLFVLFCVLPIHEFAHAVVANALGDRTAKLDGRLTLNPLAHLDLVGHESLVITGSITRNESETKRICTALLDDLERIDTVT